MSSAVLSGCALFVMIACSSQPASPAEAASPPAALAANAAPSPPSAPATPQALATAEGRTPVLRAEVTELKRTSGGTLTMRFTLINDSKQPINVADITELLDLGASFPVGGVHLIDPVGRKKYFVARDSENRCVCSEFQALQAGQRANHWAKFPAPPDDVERLSVVLPTFSPMDDVPISR
jgi:hypothetical protein